MTQSLFDIKHTPDGQIPMKESARRRATCRFSKSLGRSSAVYIDEVYSKLASIDAAAAVAVRRCWDEKTFFDCDTLYFVFSHSLET